MGTNYYTSLEPPCSTCHRSDEPVHIGKSSIGWQFTFAWNDGQYYQNLAELKEWLADKVIVDEYERVHSHEDFWALVESKKNGLTSETYRQKHPEYRRYISDEEHEIEVDGIRFMKGWFS